MHQINQTIRANSAPEKDPQSAQVSLEMSELNAACENLLARLDRLTERLQPLLLSVPVALNEREESSYLVPHAAEIKEHRLLVLAANQKVLYILENIQI